MPWSYLKSYDRVMVDKFIEVVNELNLNIYLTLANSLEFWECNYENMRYGKYHEYNDKMIR